MDEAFEIDDQLEAWVRSIAERKQRSAESIMEEAVRQYVDREEARESFRQEALDSWRDYQEPGLHITLDELSGWLKTWGTGEEVESPPCHT